MSSISIRHAAISVKRRALPMEASEEQVTKRVWLRWSDALALFGAVLVVILVKSGALGAIPF